MMVAIVMAAMSFGILAQQSKATRYTITKIVLNDNASYPDGGQGYWIRFEGANLLWVDMGFGNQMRYQFDSCQSNGNLLYYLTPYNYGTMSQGSGYVLNRQNWILVNPDRSVINMVSNNGRNVTVLKVDNANVGDMIE